jgi:inosine-uridine nucleoside N-ribohydrolase
MRLVIDSDVANEIDDLYAIALALAAPRRFEIEGFVATHFAASPIGGSQSTEKSAALLQRLLDAAGTGDVAPIALGSDPIHYPGEATDSPGVELLIEAAERSSRDDPVWVVVLGAATNVASALLKRRDLADRLRVVFHARCPEHWPTRTQQFNVVGDVLATQVLLDSKVPLVWFDTGTELTQSMEESAIRLRPLGEVGRFIHDYRAGHHAWVQHPDKGIFDLADLAWMIDPTLCRVERVPAPKMLRHLFFDQTAGNGEMLRVTDINASRTWELFFDFLSRGRA